MAHIEYRSIKWHELRPELFEHFIRHQVLDLCYPKIDDDWDIVRPQAIMLAMLPIHVTACLSIVSNAIEQ